jgi:hypothetical protein
MEIAMEKSFYICRPPDTQVAISKLSETQVISGHTPYPCYISPI